MWMTTEQAAEHLSLSVTTLKRWRQSSEREGPPAHNIGTIKRPTWRYNRDELDAWVLAQ